MPSILGIDISQTHSGLEGDHNLVNKGCEYCSNNSIFYDKWMFLTNVMHHTQNNRKWFSLNTF